MELARRSITTPIHGDTRGGTRSGMPRAIPSRIRRSPGRARGPRTRRAGQVGHSGRTGRRADALEAAGVAAAFFVFGVAWVASLPATAEAPYLHGVKQESVQGSDEAAEASNGERPPDDLPEARVWLVDGYNVLHAALLHREDRGQFWSRPHRERLRARVECFGERADEVWIVFDGGDPDGGAEGRAAGGAVVRTVFAPSADDWLVKRVRDAERPHELAVVTADRQVAGRSRHRGARVVSPRLFLARCPTS
jgi:predicted RNA-binding protein with PIN domain